MNITGISLANPKSTYQASFRSDDTPSNDVKVGYDELEKLSAKNMYPDSKAVQGNGPKKKSSVGKWITTLIVLLAIGTYYYKRKGKVPQPVADKAAEIMKK